VFLTAASLAFAADPAGGKGLLARRGTGSIHTVTVPGSATGYETRQGPQVDAHFVSGVSGTVAPARVPADHVPRPAASAVSSGSNFSGFNGISRLDQRLAGGGNQFSIEPPDQALAVGNGYVLESVNLALAVYLTDGTQVGIASSNDFFNLSPAILRSSNPPVFGPFLSDPRAYFDSATGDGSLPCWRSTPIQQPGGSWDIPR
jgi:hypothetical protein